MASRFAYSSDTLSAYDLEAGLCYTWLKLSLPKGSSSLLYILLRVRGPSLGDCKEFTLGACGGFYLGDSNESSPGGCKGFTLGDCTGFSPLTGSLSLTPDPIIPLGRISQALSFSSLGGLWIRGAAGGMSGAPILPVTGALGALPPLAAVSEGKSSAAVPRNSTSSSLACYSLACYSLFLAFLCSVLDMGAG